MPKPELGPAAAVITWHLRDGAEESARRRGSLSSGPFRLLLTTAGSIRIPLTWSGELRIERDEAGRVRAATFDPAIPGHPPTLPAPLSAWRLEDRKNANADNCTDFVAPATPAGPTRKGAPNADRV